MLDTPVLFLIFNRPALTGKVFEEIKKQKPKYLYVAADGPRENNEADTELCSQCIEIITQGVNWDCELKTLFRESNLNSKYAISDAINWFFENEEEGIILEDDCLPGDSFFFFCAELLAKYRDDDQIMHITGTNLDDNFKYGDGTFYFSKYGNNWGWATWKRAWGKFDLEMNNTKKYLDLIDKTFAYTSEKIFWRSRIWLIKASLINAWDYQWMFTIWRENGICLNSNYNLVTNIGFNANATHTTGKSPYITPGIKTINAIEYPASNAVVKNAERRFLYLLHGVKRRRYLQHYFQIHISQRIQNLFHKIKMAAGRIKNKVQFEK